MNKGPMMNLSTNNLRVVKFSKEEPHEKKCKKNYLELAPLAVRVAELPNVRPILDNFSEKKSFSKKDPLSRDIIKESFKGSIHHPQKSFWYSLSLFFSLAFMVTVAAIYLYMMFIVGSFVWSQLSSFIANYSTQEYLTSVSQGLLTVLGSLLFLGMLKAILMSRAKRAVSEIKVEEEPVLFFYLENICKSLNTPLPGRVFLTCDVDISCHSRWSFKKKYDIYIGMPLVSSFSTKELAGVLAHELCRYSKNVPFLVEPVRSIYLWMGKVCCHKDQFNKHILLQREKVNSSSLKLLLLSIEQFIKVPQQILHGFMWFTHLFCQYSIHRIDYESDYYEMQFAGNSKFEEIAYNMVLMSETSNNTLSGINVSKRNKTLYDDLSGHIAATTVMLNEEKQYLINKFKNKKERISEIHPAFRKRIAKAESCYNPGIIKVEEPSVRLLVHLLRHKRMISLEQYKVFFGKGVPGLNNLRPTELELRDMNELAFDMTKLNKFFQGIVSFEKIPLTNQKRSILSLTTIKALRSLKEVKSQMQLTSNNISSLHKEHEQVSCFARLLESAKIVFEKSSSANSHIEIMGRRVTRKNIDTLIDESVASMKSNKDQLEEFFDLCSTRISHAIKLVNCEKFRAKMPDGDIYRNNLTNTLHYLRIFDQVQDPLLSLKAMFTEVKFLLESNSDNAELVTELETRKHGLYECLKKVEANLLEIPDPFSTSFSHNIMDYVGLDVPSGKDFSELLYVAEEIYERTTAIYYKVLGRLVHIVNEAEATAGLEERSTDIDFGLSRVCG